MPAFRVPECLALVVRKRRLGQLRALRARAANGPFLHARRATLCCVTPEDYLDGRLAELEAGALYRDPDDGRARDEALLAAASLGRPLMDASSNDYLGLAGRHVSRETLGSWTVATGSGASRLIHGSRAPHVELEAEVASWVQLPSALLFSSGYAANIGTISALGGPRTVVLSDELNHASIIDGCRLARAEVRVVPHLDLGAYERLLASIPADSARWVVTESYFSMDGDGPDLAVLRELCDRHGAGLVVDEAHALGVFGPHGGGRCAEAGITPDVLIGTFGKAVGVQGAFVAGSERLRRVLWNAARSFVFSTAPSPLISALSLFHVKQARTSEAARAALWQRCDQLRTTLAALGMSTPRTSFGPIVPVMINDNKRALAVTQRLLARGVLTQAIRPPTVPAGTARLRLTVTAQRSPDEIALLANEVAAAVDDKDPPIPAITKPRRPRRVVILGTGTGVGKTFVSAALARRLRARGLQVAAIKPVETGTTDPVGADANLLARATGRAPSHDALVFADPVTPRLAAERAGVEIDLRRLVRVVEEAERDPSLEFIIVEAAGGAFSPIATDASNVDLAVLLEPATWVLVAPDALGVLHDVSATMRAMVANGRPPDHLVLCAARPSDESSGTNASELTRLGYAPTAVVSTGDESGVEALLEALRW